MTRRRPDPEPALSIFPNQIHIGDRFSEADIGDEDREWEVVSRPVTFKKGQEVRACVQRPDNPAASREKYWPAFQKITVRPGGRGCRRRPNRTTPEPVDGDDVEALRKELWRLRGEVARLDDDKRELERRLGFMQRQIEELRKKRPASSLLMYSRVIRAGFASSAHSGEEIAAFPPTASGIPSPPGTPPGRGPGVRRRSSRGLGRPR